MENRNDLQIKQYIKQLEEENLSLKRQLLDNLKFENTQVIRLKFIIDTQERQIEELKRKCAKLQLGIA